VQSQKRTTQIFIALCACGLLAISTANFRMSRSGPQDNPRVCSCNLKTLAGAVEMYDLDENGAPLRAWRERWYNEALPSSRPLLEKLKKLGYLQSVPMDYAEKRYEEGNYVILPDGTAFCMRHGLIGGPYRYGNRQPAEQLLALGIDNPILLERTMHVQHTRQFDPALSRSQATIAGALIMLIIACLRVRPKPAYVPLVILSLGCLVLATFVGPDGIFAIILTCVGIGTLVGFSCLAIYSVCFITRCFTEQLGDMLFSERRRPTTIPKISTKQRKTPSSRTTSAPQEGVFLSKPTINAAHARCPVCGSGFSANDETCLCSDCNTPYHRDCFLFARGCAIYGCGGSVAIEVHNSPPRPRYERKLAQPEFLLLRRHENLA